MTSNTAFLHPPISFANKQPDVCPGQGVGQQTIRELDPNGEPFKKLVKTLVDHNVALTSTLTVFETFATARPKPPGLEVLLPELREQFEQTFERVSAGTTQGSQNYKALLPKGMALEHAFAKAGGLLVAGTDPTGSGGVIPGYANQREIELLVEAGFTPLEAISIGSLNGAKYLGRDRLIGTIAAGKQADLVVVTGDPSQVDLPGNVTSGLADAWRKLAGVDGIGQVRLDASDVVRHQVVSRIVTAYEAANQSKPRA